jgi:hypothetical protein
MPRSHAGYKWHYGDELLSPSCHPAEGGQPRWQTRHDHHGRSAWPLNARHADGPSSRRSKHCGCRQTISCPTIGTCCACGRTGRAGATGPAPEYQRLIATAFGTVAATIFGPDASSVARPAQPEPVIPEGETLELVERMRRSDLDDASLETLAITVQRLCSEYAFMPAADVRREGRAWMAKLVRLLDSRMTLAQHREVLVLAGWLALLVGCVEHDMRDLRSAEATRQAAASLGHEADHAEIMAWAQEMICWFALTQGRYRQVVEAARTGRWMAPHDPVSVQLAGQEAKAWARMGDRRQVELALERGRQLLETLPYPDNIDNHFAFDPDTFDFYAMDCYAAPARTPWQPCTPTR